MCVRLSFSRSQRRDVVNVLVCLVMSLQVQAKRIEAERRVAAMLKAKQSGGGGPS